ncbi:hypothetical protein [Crocinitomix catalasitica]|uniref:hypothetical protein n=1 Tax=Crocinitomix catalasitica TaxID=184607 RepID=UPI00047FBFCD|nr:hypothetical protein [Crocinitomix catalasitica]
MKRVFQISVVFLIFGFITNCKVDERKMEFIRDLQNRYNCEVSLGDTYEKRTNQDTKKFIKVTFSDCYVLKKDKNKEMTGIALEVFKMNLDDIDLAGVIMDVNSEETIFDTDLLNEVLKGEAYMFDLFNLISLKNMIQYMPT